MSFAITVFTNEGIIMASDSRLTRTAVERKMDGSVIYKCGIDFTDSVYKTFKCNERIGLSSCGNATINNMPIAGFINAFISNNVTEDSSVEDVAKATLTYFSKFTPVPDTHFIIAGYNKDDEKQHVVQTYVAENQIKTAETSLSGAVWDGETEILMRLVKPVALKQGNGVYVDLSYNSISFQCFTLQDAIDFAEYAVDVTIKTMAFQNCVKSVGGPIDILAIKPDGAFWIKRKELHA
ncbi:MAG: hypothetical protein LUG62_01015 [Clostridiales bacterium]|nr:hypothetical protein [Clostridiales bacterium]